MKQVEDRFNHWAHYDYVFLNDEVSSLRPRPIVPLADMTRNLVTSSRSRYRFVSLGLI